MNNLTFFFLNSVVKITYWEWFWRTVFEDKVHLFQELNFYCWLNRLSGPADGSIYNNLNLIHAVTSLTKWIFPLLSFKENKTIHITLLSMPLWSSAVVLVSELIESLALIGFIKVVIKKNSTFQKLAVVLCVCAWT